MGQINLGRVRGEDGASVFIKYNTKPDDEGATDFWSEGQNYIGVQTAKADTRPPKGYIWSLFMHPAVDNLTSTSTTKPLSANQGRILSETKLTKPTGAADQFLNGVGVPAFAMSTPLENSGNPFSAGGAYAELAKKTNINTTAQPVANMPVGSYILARVQALTNFIGGTMNIYFSDNYSYTTAITGSPVTGTWRFRGAVDVYNQLWGYVGLFERTE